MLPSGELKVLTWGDYPRLSGFAQCHHKGPSGRDAGEAFEDAPLLALNMEEGGFGPMTTDNL